MKKIAIVIVTAISAIGLPHLALAKADFSFGYAVSKLEQRGSLLNGFNIKFNLESDVAPIGFIVSYTSIDSDYDFYDYIDDFPYRQKYAKDFSRQYNLLIGPSFRVFPFLTFYGLAGIAYKEDYYKWYHPRRSVQTRYYPNDEHIDYDVSFAYGVGVRLMSAPDFIIDIGYESNYDGSDFKDFSFRGITVGVGYRF